MGRRPYPSKPLTRHSRMTHTFSVRRALALAALTVACSHGDGGANAGGATRNSAGAQDYRKQPGYIIDSLLPMEEYLRRFRVGMTEPTALTSGMPERDALVRTFMTALAKRDTGQLSRMTLTKAEFAWLYFPHHPISRPPFELPPELTWFQIGANGHKGSVRMLERFGGQTLRYLGHVCPDSSIRAVGEGREYDRCRVIVARAGGARDTLRFFGPVFERRGQFKFVSYANDF